MTITVDEFSKILNNKYIIVEGFREHSKASEKYIDVQIIQKDSFIWKGSIPYFYRRTGVFIETPEELAEYLEKIYPNFTKKAIKIFQKEEKERWETEFSGKKTTKGFFDILLNLKWNSVQQDLPSNRNFARRIQDIKELGYSLATDTKRKIEGTYETDTHILLVPIPKGGVSGYEVMSPEFKAKAIKVLEATNIYELSSANKHGLLPDHKFSEIRWDIDTKEDNPENMSESQIKDKFQLLDNQRNQQKREACRNCFQTGMRGKIFGINYFYAGSQEWDNKIPKIGKKAERGCIGCGWYDIRKWRDSLNKLLANK